MRRGSPAGFGALAFAVLPIAGLIVANDPGGTYKASDIADYVRSGHRPLVFLGLYLSVLGIAGLMLFLGRLRESIADETKARVFWGFSIAACAGMAGGLAVTATVPIAMGYGGRGVSIAPAVAYVFSEAGWVVISAGAVFLGCALLTFTAGVVAVPAWVRWSTVVAALAAIAGAAWFPFALVLIWAFALGIWLLVAERAPAAAPVGA